MVLVMEKKLLIMTIYAPSDYNHHWYKLQKKYIKKTTSVPYDFKVITNQIGERIFDTGEVVISNNENIGHPKGIRQIFDYMKKNGEYSGYLLLDSDCFPVRYDWHNILDRQMLKFNKDIAAPIRFENLDFFPHPCFVYLNNSGLKNPSLNFDYETIRNLLDKEVNEVGGNMQKIMNDVLPLLRTNKINLHQVASGIYHHLFYHHGAGSRGFQFRVQKEYNYYDHIGIDDDTELLLGEQMMKALLSNPEEYIDKLMYGY